MKSPEYSRNDLLGREKPQTSEQKLTFNITYYSDFQNVRTIMEELHILLTPNKEHKRLFPNVLVTQLRPLQQKPARKLLKFRVFS